ncbi:tRNA methyltransferase complex GCD14 subunit-domain-containing protein [Xylariales sp. PMI_506]|nr:tRNA methyltransferase complex GCD14 subunit-domain-containing protein [Xylariales sp. PMI_506]
MRKISPFLDPGPRTSANSLAIVHLSRDNLVPAILNGEVGEVDGYAEGTVINTRFGSFPHSTLINQSWGAQVRASIVDTGTRGRKRKVRDDDTGNDTEEAGPGEKKVTTASSGFVHVLPPTPELWTMSLPHRTQVVYTPDYSYILHRIRARPGMRIIEAGAGSGSFTHASVRAVYNGMPKGSSDPKGKVFSFEFNEDRFHQMEKEIEAHGLRDLVKITHRDVYSNGFLVDGKSPEAECVFLDLPAPWKALPHLSRSRVPSSDASDSATSDDKQPWISPLRADRAVHLCTFSPCIEQVTQTVETMRKLGWMEIEMVEVLHRRITVLRERVGLNMPAERGSNQSPYDVAEAVGRLREVEGRSKDFHERSQKSAALDGSGDQDTDMTDGATGPALQATNGTDKSVKPGDSVPAFMQGRLIHRTEPEIKTHTSYLVFAVLPQEWSEEQEAAAFARWPCGKEEKIIGSLNKAVRKQEKRDFLQAKKKTKAESKS